MNLLLDTHTSLWLVLNDPQLSARARSLLVDPAKRTALKKTSYQRVMCCWRPRL
jgi:PIN domain nuclease of toxin-antitoxin system